MKSLKTVTDRFSLVDTIRRHTPQNTRNYILKSVRETFNSPEVKECISLGEMYGYYGHGRRQIHYAKTGKLTLPEVSVAIVEGKPVTLTNVPSNRTISVSVDDDGVVTHTQEILDTDPGHIVSGMEASNAGGWSWATGGSDCSVRSVVTGFYGFDYVTTPNYISLDKSSLMLESSGTRTELMIAALTAAGFTENAATDLCQHFETLREDQAMFEAVEHTSHLESQMWALQGRLVEMQARVSEQNAMLESAGELTKTRRRIMRETLNNLPIFISKEQRQSLLRMESAEDIQVLSAMLESAAGNASSSLPIGDRTPRQRDPGKQTTTASDDDVLWLRPNK
ncbi:MAG: head processing protein [Hafnia sp.]